MEGLKTNVVNRLYYGDFDMPKEGTRCRLKLEAESKTAALLKARDIALEKGWRIRGIVYQDQPFAGSVQEGKS